VLAAKEAARMAWQREVLERGEECRVRLLRYMSSRRYARAEKRPPAAPRANKSPARVQGGNISRVKDVMRARGVLSCCHRRRGY